MKNRLTTGNTFIRILIVMLLVMIGFSCCYNTVYAEEIKNMKFDDTDLLDELNSIDGFDFADYPFDSTGTVEKPRVFNVIEYSYSFKPLQRANYGLYIYFYNPQGLQLNTKSILNSVQIASEYEKKDNALIPTDYEKYKLKFCSTIENGVYAHRFYKFRVVDKIGKDGLHLVERVDPDNRRYDISGVELHSLSANSSTEYEVGGTYTFSGYASGYGPNPNDGSTISSTQRELETVELIPVSTYYRTGTSALGKGYQNQLDSVYFAVPNSLLKVYGELKRIKAQWYEYKTSPIVVVEDAKIYSAMQSNLGKMTIANSIMPKFYADLKTNIIPGLPSPTYYHSMSWGYNVPNDTSKTHFKYETKSDYLTYIYQSSNLADFRLSGHKLIEDMYAYNDSYHKGQLSEHPSSSTGKGLSADLFSDKVDKGHIKGFQEKVFDTDQVSEFFNMLDYNSNPEHSDWDKFFDYFGSYPADEQSYFDIPPIMGFDPLDINLNDEEISKKYLIELTDVAEFRLYYENNKSDSTIFKFNFGHSQYYSNKLDCSHTSGYYSEGFVAEQTVYLKFDIIYLEFKLDGIYHIIPVVSNPIDIAGDITPPLEITDPSNWLFWLMLVLGVIAFVLLLPILAPLIGIVLNVLVYIIKAPFVFVGFVAGSIKNNFSTEEKTKSPKNKKTKSKGKTKGTDDYYIDQYNKNLDKDNYET